MSELINLKKSFNPLNQHGVWAHNAFDAALEDAAGTIVIAKDGAIPFITSQLISKEVRIIGNVEIANDVTIRRVSEVSGSDQRPTILKQYALLMDYCTVRDSTLEEGAGFAHGGISENATWGAWSFANIAPVLKGTAEEPITVEPGAYIGPGVSVPKGALIHANNYYLGTPAIILPRTELDQDTLIPKQGWDKFYAGQDDEGDAIFRPIFLSEADFEWLNSKTEQLLALTEGSDEYKAVAKAIDRKLKHVWRLDRRPYRLSPFGNYDTTELADVGVDTWIKSQDRNVVHRPTLANWLWFYHQTQHIKQAAYQQEAAKQHGDIVWHNAPLQSEVLHLDRAQRILIATNNHDIQDLQNLIKAKLFLLGAYKPKADEHAALNDAFLNANTIINHVQLALAAITDDVNITVHRQAVIDHALKPVSTADRVVFTIDAHERKALSARLGQFAAIYAHVPEATQSIQVRQDAPRTNSSIEIPAWILAINAERTNFVTLADGPHVRSFAGHVPVIEDGAILLGNVDLSGAVHLDGGVVLKNGSVCSEQSTAPVTILGKSYIEGAITHTATKEQYPVLVDGRVGPIVIKGGHIHGAEIDAYTYSEDALLSDEALIRGVVANGAMNIGQKHARSASENGQLVFEGGSPSKNVLKEGGNTLASYQQWWDKHPHFRDLPLEEDAVKQRIAEIHSTQYVNAQQELADKVREHGPLYKISAPLQAAIFNLTHGAEIFEKQGDTRNAAELRLHIEGIEYLLGARDTLSIGAAERLEAKGNLSRAVLALQAIGKRGEVIEIANWNEKTSPYTYTHADALNLAKNSHRPITEIAQRNFDLADDARLKGEADVKHAMTPEDAIKRGLRETVDYYPKHITLIAQGIDHIPTLLAQVRAAAANVMHLSNQHRNLAATPTLTL